jgi:antitoxin component HigA of HigAB toxin-antitoxin module
MNLRPIHRDDDPAQALAAVERLWGGPQDSQAAEELEVLLILIAAYEEKPTRLGHTIPNFEPLAPGERRSRFTAARTATHNETHRRRR